MGEVISGNDKIAITTSHVKWEIHAPLRFGGHRVVRPRDIVRLVEDNTATAIRGHSGITVDPMHVVDGDMARTAVGIGHADATHANILIVKGRLGVAATIEPSVISRVDDVRRAAGHERPRETGGPCHAALKGDGVSADGRG